LKKQKVKNEKLQKTGKNYAALKMPVTPVASSKKVSESLYLDISKIKMYNLLLN